MDLRTIREDITYEYAEGKNYKIIERTFFSNAGYMYLIFDEEHNEKSLFVTSLEKDQEHLINSYIKLVEIYRVNKILKDIKIEINEIDDKGFVIFILMEPIILIVDWVVNHREIKRYGETAKRIWFIESIKRLKEQMKIFKEKMPEINMFINNEAIGVNSELEPTILLFNGPQNEVCTDNNTNELRIIFSSIANGLRLTRLNEDIWKDVDFKLHVLTKKYNKEYETEHKYFEKCQKKSEKKTKYMLKLGYLYEKGKGTASLKNGAVFYIKSQFVEKRTTS